MIVIAGLAVSLPQALINERAVYVNGVRGTVLQGVGTGQGFIDDFVPRSAWARASGAPFRVQIPGDATWVRAGFGRGFETRLVVGVPAEISRQLPTDYWDWMVLEVFYGSSRNEEYGWRFSDALDDSMLISSPWPGTPAPSP